MQKAEVGYSYYFNEYCMGASPMIPSDEFERFIKSAKQFLDAISINQHDGIEDTALKECLCAVSEELYKESKRGGIKNENIDGYSVTYNENKSVRSRLMEIATLYLGKSGLLYAGVE